MSLERLTKEERQLLYSLIEYKLLELKEGDFCESQKEQEDQITNYLSIQNKLFFPHLIK